MANTGMETPTDSPRTESAAALMTEKETCFYLKVEHHIEPVEIYICQQWRDDPALRRAFAITLARRLRFAGFFIALDDRRTQPPPDQSQDAAIGHLAGNCRWRGRCWTHWTGSISLRVTRGKEYSK